MLLGESPVLQWVVDRARRIPGTDDVVVATSRERQDDPIASFCDRREIPVFRGSENDVLDRVFAAARGHQSDAIVRVTADCPLLDPEQSGRVVAAFRHARDASYASNVLPRMVPNGLDTEVISMAALAAAWEEATDPADREHVTSFVNRRPKRFRPVAVEGPPIAPERRLTLDTLSDFVLLSALVDRLYSGGTAGTVREVLAILDEPEVAELADR